MISLDNCQMFPGEGGTIPIWKPQLYSDTWEPLAFMIQSSKNSGTVKLVRDLLLWSIMDIYLHVVALLMYHSCELLLSLFLGSWLGRRLHVCVWTVCFWGRGWAVILRISVFSSPTSTASHILLYLPYFITASSQKTLRVDRSTAVLACPSSTS